MYHSGQAKKTDTKCKKKMLRAQCLCLLCTRGVKGTEVIA